VACILLVLLLVTNGPLFLCMPLTDDAAMYDLQARNLLRGGVLYRDIHEPNLPGVVWIHTAVRGIFGNSSVVLRAVDLAFFSCLVALLWNWLRVAGSGRRIQAWTVLVLFFCYLSMSEWCHCQRDVWLLVPGLGALTLRRRQTEAWRAGKRPLRSVAWWGLIEGLCWGTGVWLKPMIVVPAACCWLVSAVQLRNWRAVLVDLGGLLAGGIAIGAAGIVWLYGSGAWPYFVTTLVEWNPRYMQAGREHWTGLRYVSMLYRFFPWQFIHLAAVPVAIATVVRAGGQWKSGRVEEAESQRVEKSKSEKVEESESQRVKESRGQCVQEPKSTSGACSDLSTFRPSDFSTSPSPDSSTSPSSDLSTLRLFDFSSLLLSVFYLAWLIQSYALQHLFDYVHAPGVLLAVAVLAVGAFGRADVAARRLRMASRTASPAPSEESSMVAHAESDRATGHDHWRIAAVGFLAVAVLASPAMRSERLSRWWSCVTQGSTAQNRDRLKLLVMPQWRDLERVSEYVRTLKVHDGELTCYNSSLVHLYWLLDWRAPTRYVYLEQIAIYFPDRQDAFLRDLNESRQRYVTSDLTASGLPAERIESLCPEGALSRPPLFPSRLSGVFPWSQPAIFRAGPYLVHRVERPLGRLNKP